MWRSRDRSEVRLHVRNDDVHVLGSTRMAASMAETKSRCLSGRCSDEGKVQEQKSVG